MSFVNPEKLPVSVYRWDDENAPKLDKSAGCVSTILKACLVTGYGTKQGAGWTMPYEDLQAGVKVLRPPVSAEQDFYLRLSADNGSELTAQVYTAMSNINTGDLKLQCNTAFKYATAEITGKWLLLATTRGICFFNALNVQGGSDNTRTGAYFLCGDTAKNSIGDKGIYLKHSGGEWGGWMEDIFSGNPKQSVNGKLFDSKKNSVADCDPVAIFDGKSNKSTNLILSQLCLIALNEVWLLPAFSPSVVDKNNYETINTGDAIFLNHATSQDYTSNFYVRTDFWEY